MFSVTMLVVAGREGTDDSHRNGSTLLRSRVNGWLDSDSFTDSGLGQERQDHTTTREWRFSRFHESGVSWVFPFLKTLTVG